MKIGELRKLTAHLPDDTDLVIDNGDAVYWELGDHRMYPPVLDQSWCVVLLSGTEVTFELDMHVRDGYGFDGDGFDGD